MGESTVESTSGVACCCVFDLECVVQVYQVGAIGVLDIEIINNKGTYLWQSIYPYLDIDHCIPVFCQSSQVVVLEDC